MFKLMNKIHAEEVVRGGLPTQYEREICVRKQNSEFIRKILITADTEFY